MLHLFFFYKIVCKLLRGHAVESIFSLSCDGQHAVPCSCADVNRPDWRKGIWNIWYSWWGK